MKVLIVRVGAMGDVLHALPAVAALRRARPEWEIGWVVDPRWAPVLVGGEIVAGKPAGLSTSPAAPVEMTKLGQGAGKAGTYVSRVHLADTKLWKAGPASWATLRSVAALRREMRRERYDLVVDMQGTLRSAVVGRMAGAREFVGYADPRERAAARLYRTRVLRDGVHVVQQGLNLLSAATGVTLEAGAVELPRASWAEDWAEREAVLRRADVRARSRGRVGREAVACGAVWAACGGTAGAWVRCGGECSACGQ